MRTETVNGDNYRCGFMDPVYIVYLGYTVRKHDPPLFDVHTMQLKVLSSASQQPL